MTLATDLFEPRRTRALRWTIAAVLVVVAHIGCTALALMHWQEDDAEDSPAGPIIVEMVAPPVATPQDMPDVAHGPLMEEAQASPQAAKETKVEVEKETPEVEPSPAPEPEVVLPVPKPVVEKKPEEEEQPKQEVAEQQSAQLANPAPLTTAPPRVEAKEAPVAAGGVARHDGSLRAQHCDVGAIDRVPPQSLQALSGWRPGARHAGLCRRSVQHRPLRQRARRPHRADVRIDPSGRGGAGRRETRQPHPLAAGRAAWIQARPDVADPIPHPVGPRQAPGARGRR